MEPAISSTEMARAALVAIRERLRLVVACALLLPLISVAVAVLAPSDYEATSRLAINPATSSPTLVNLGITGIAPPTGGELKSDTILRAIQEQLIPRRQTGRRGGRRGRRRAPPGPPPVSLSELRDRLVIEEAVGGAPGEGARTVTLVAKGTTQREAVGLANTWAGAVVNARNQALARALQKARRRLRALERQTRAAGSATQADRLERQITRIDTAGASIEPDIQVVESAQGTSGPTRFLNPVAALLLGILLGVGLALVLALLDRKLRTAATIRAAFGLPVLGHLLDGANAGSEPGARIRSANNLLSRLAIANAGKAPSNLLIASGDPGTDAGRAARALAATLAASGRSVLVVNWSARFMSDTRRISQPVGQASGISVMDWTGGWRDLEPRLKELGESKDVVVVNAPSPVAVSEVLLAAQTSEQWAICATIGLTQRDHAAEISDELESLPKAPAGLITLDPPGQVAAAAERRRRIPLPRLRRRRAVDAKPAHQVPTAGSRPPAAAKATKERRSGAWIRRRKVAKPRQETQRQPREHR
jgi:hypothetical protein